jgi:hypothetical protein
VPANLDASTQQFSSSGFVASQIRAMRVDRDHRQGRVQWLRPWLAMHKPAMGADGGQRDYFSTLGRWTSLDPLGYDAGDIILYWAQGNSPAHGTDPSGLI